MHLNTKKLVIAKTDANEGKKPDLAAFHDIQSEMAWAYSYSTTLEAQSYGMYWGKHANL